MLSALLREWWFTNNTMWLGEGGLGRMGEMEKGKYNFEPGR